MDTLSRSQANSIKEGGSLHAVVSFSYQELLDWGLRH